MGRGTRWKGTAGDHKGPPSRSPPPSPLRNDEHVSNKPTRVRARGAGKDPATLFPRQLERVPVTLSAAKGLGSWAARSFAALRMTARTPLKSAHGKPYLQLSSLRKESLPYPGLGCYDRSGVRKPPDVTASPIGHISSLHSVIEVASKTQPTYHKTGSRETQPGGTGRQETTLNR